MTFEIKDANLIFSRPLANRARTTGIVLHHYAHPAREGQTLATPQDVHRWHLARGWAGIGYNFVVDQDGTIWNGRGMEAGGAHVTGHNSSTVGIGCQGNFDSVHTKMSDAQYNALVWLLKHIRERYGEIPFKGHRHFAQTACPGRHFPMAELLQLEYRQRGEREDMRLQTVEQFSKSLRPEIQSLIDAGHLRGRNNDGTMLDFTEGEMRAMLVMARKIDALESRLEKAISRLAEEQRVD
ncbi:MAG: peptidoglycan recognition protein family protein [Defluviitaleaceae bacterium]|nr:peptidoglycan recognition protein family protein [Defluviitaleaceae bacterium]